MNNRLLNLNGPRVTSSIITPYFRDAMSNQFQIVINAFGTFNRGQKQGDGIRCLVFGDYVFFGDFGRNFRENVNFRNYYTRMGLQSYLIAPTPSIGLRTCFKLSKIMSVNDNGASFALGMLIINANQQSWQRMSQRTKNLCLLYNGNPIRTLTITLRNVGAGSSSGTPMHRNVGRAGPYTTFVQSIIYAQQSRTIPDGTNTRNANLQTTTITRTYGETDTVAGNFGRAVLFFSAEGSHEVNPAPVAQTRSLIVSHYFINRTERTSINRELNQLLQYPTEGMTGTSEPNERRRLEQAALFGLGNLRTALPRAARPEQKRKKMLKNIQNKTRKERQKDLNRARGMVYTIRHGREIIAQRLNRAGVIRKLRNLPTGLGGFRNYHVNTQNRSVNIQSNGAINFLNLGQGDNNYRPYLN
jgi:hypothetical protein